LHVQVCIEMQTLGESPTLEETFSFRKSLEGVCFLRRQKMQTLYVAFTQRARQRKKQTPSRLFLKEKVSSKVGPSPSVCFSMQTCTCKFGCTRCLLFTSSQIAKMQNDVFLIPFLKLRVSSKVGPSPSVCFSMQTCTCKFEHVQKNDRCSHETPSNSRPQPSRSAMATDTELRSGVRRFEFQCYMTFARQSA